MHLKEKVSIDVQNNKVQYLLIVFLLVVGITAGTFTVSNLGYAAREELTDYVQLLFVTVKTSSIDYLSILFFSWLQNTLVFVTMTCFSLLMIGIPVIAVVLIFKGFCVGFTVGVLSLSIGSGGFFAIVFATFIPNIVLIPCVCKTGALGWNNSILIFKDRRTPKTTRDRLINARPFFQNAFKIYLIALIGVLLESFLTPTLLKLI